MLWWTLLVCALYSIFRTIDGVIEIKKTKKRSIGLEVALHLTVVTNTSVRSGVVAPVKDAHAASVVPNEMAAHETPAAPGWSSNGP